MEILIEHLTHRYAGAESPVLRDVSLRIGSGECVALMRRGHVAAAAHFGQADAETRFGELPGGFASGEPAADHLHFVGCHA